MLRVLSSRQIEEWSAAYRLDPWGEQPAYWRAGVVASTLANIYKKKGSRPMTPGDFFPAPRVSKRKQTMDQMKAALLGIASWARTKGILVEKKKGEQS